MLCNDYFQVAQTYLMQRQTSRIAAAALLRAGSAPPMALASTALGRGSFQQLPGAFQQVLGGFQQPPVSFQQLQGGLQQLPRGLSAAVGQVGAVRLSSVSFARTQQQGPPLSDAGEICQRG